MAKPQQGRDLIIYRATSTQPLVGAVKTCTIKQRTDFIEVPATTTENNAHLYRHYKPEYRGWSISFNFIAMDDNIAPLEVGQTVNLRVGIKHAETDTHYMIYRGEAFVEEAEVTGTVRSLTAGSFLLRGNGPLVNIEE